MLKGIQLPNHSRLLSALEILRLKALRPECIRSYTYTTPEQYQQVIDAVGKPLVILRDHRNESIDPPVWAQDIWHHVDILKALGLDFWLAPINEPNHPEGPYPNMSFIEDFKRDYGALVGELDRVLPNVPLVSPNLAVRYHDLEWAMSCYDIFHFHKYIGTNAYWQYEHHLDPEWGLRIGQFRNIFPDKDFVVLEMGDATPFESSQKQCARMKAVLQTMERLTYVAAVSIFILGYDEQSPQTWGGFVYRPIDLAALRKPVSSVEELEALAETIAAEEQLPWDIVERLIDQESGWDPRAVSPVGAEGLMQLMPEFYPNIDRFDPEQNLRAGCQALAYYIQDYRWDYAKALAAYNWGPGNVGEAEEYYGSYWWLGLPEETKRYIKAILFPG